MMDVGPYLRSALSWRRTTWAMIAWQALSLAMLGYVLLVARSQTSCQDFTGAGAFCRFQAVANGLSGLLRLAIVYFTVTAVLGLVWAWSQPDHPACPDCGSQARTDAGKCRKCGHDFFAADAGRAPLAAESTGSAASEDR